MDQIEKEQQPVMDLPPVGDTGNLPEVIERQGSERNPELLPAAQRDDPVTSVPSPVQPVWPSASPRPSAAQPSVSNTQNPSIADDVDLIEKEWVEKAKEIVEKTKDNPYLQNKAISEFKADYIKKRYNKDLTQGHD